MIRFREHTFFDCDGRIRVRKYLLNAILHSRLPGDNATESAIPGIPKRPSRSTEHPHTSCRPLKRVRLPSDEK
jgi:hypothetical protein